MSRSGEHSGTADHRPQQQVLLARTLGASADDVLNVWRYVSNYIEKQMLKGKGVAIAGLGTFTLAEPLPNHSSNEASPAAAVGAGKKPRPVFLLAEKLLQLHDLAYAKKHIDGKVPVADLNYAAVASESPYSRDFVERVVHFVVHEMSTALAAGRNVDFRLEGIGRLAVRDKKVKMKFLKDFLTELDPSGRLAADLRGRPNTADSVISRATTARPPTANTLALPSREPAAALRGRMAMGTIEEEGAGCSGGEDKAAGDTVVPPAAEATAGRHKECSDSHDDRRDGKCERNAEPDCNKPEAMPTKIEDGGDEPPEARKSSRMGCKVRGESSARAPAPVSTAGVVSFDELLAPPLQPQTAVAAVAQQEQRQQHQQQLQSEEMCPGAEADRRRVAPSGDGSVLRWIKSLTPHHALRSAPPMGSSTPAVAGDVVAAAAVETAEPAGDGEGHGCASSHCHLCRKRREANVRISLSAERARRDAGETLLLHRYQLLKEREALLKEAELQERRAGELRDQAEFNAAVATAKQTAQKLRGGSAKEQPRSYIFFRRPLTPHRSVKQSLMASALDEQTERQTAAAAANRAHEDMMGRLEQVALAEELAKQRELYHQRKLSGHQRYKTALETQMRYRPLPIPASQPDSEVFGKCEPTAEDIDSRRKQARALMTDHAESDADRKRAYLLQRIQDQQEATQLLQRNRDEIVEDMARRYEQALRQRRALENDWLASTHAKRARELEERVRSLAVDDVLVHEQCDKYRRCAQCQRRLSNAGQSGVWRDGTRFVNGTRMMA